VEPLPDLNALSDNELKELIEELERDEDEISYQRRLLHGRLDILRAERTARLKKGGAHVDVDKLSDILAKKVPPPEAE
jgi:aryl carrier-like protein